MAWTAKAREIAVLIAAIATLVTAGGNAIVAIRTGQAVEETHAEVEEVHRTINSRLTELVEATRQAAHAAGLAAGLKIGRDRAADDAESEEGGTSSSEPATPRRPHPPARGIPGPALP